MRTNRRHLGSFHLSVTAAAELLLRSSLFFSFTHFRILFEFYHYDVDGLKYQGFLAAEKSLTLVIRSCSQSCLNKWVFSKLGDCPLNRILNEGCRLLFSWRSPGSQVLVAKAVTCGVRGPFQLFFPLLNYMVVGKYLIHNPLSQC